MATKTEDTEAGPIGRDVIAPVEILAKRMSVPLKTIRRFIRQGMPARQVDGTTLAMASDVYDRLDPVSK